MLDSGQNAIWGLTGKLHHLGILGLTNSSILINLTDCNWSYGFIQFPIIQ